MWPWEHALAGYVSFTVFSVLIRRRPLRTPEAVAVVVGTQAPDLVDKPLGWTVAILPSGRSLGHSLLTWAIVAALVFTAARRAGRAELSLPFAVGHLVGILTDVPDAALSGEFSRATFILWPLLPTPKYGGEPSIVARLSHLTPADLFQLVAVCATIVLGQIVLSAFGRTDTDRPSQ